LGAEKQDVRMRDNYGSQKAIWKERLQTELGGWKKENVELQGESQLSGGRGPTY